MVGAWGRALQRNRKTGLQLRLAFSCCVTLCQLFNLSFPRASLVAQRLKRLPTMWETWVRSLGQEDWRRKWQPTPVFLGFPGGSEVKESAHNAGDLGSIPGSGRSPGEGNSNPLQYSCLENPMDEGAWWATVHRVAKSQT